MKIIGIEKLIENIGGYECRICGGQHKDANQFIVGEDGYLRCGYCGEVVGEEITKAKERCR